MIYKDLLSADPRSASSLRFIFVMVSVLAVLVVIYTCVLIWLQYPIEYIDELIEIASIIFGSAFTGKIAQRFIETRIQKGFKKEDYEEEKLEN